MATLKFAMKNKTKTKNRVKDEAVDLLFLPGNTVTDTDASRQH